MMSKLSVATTVRNSPVRFQGVMNTELASSSRMSGRPNRVLASNALSAFSTRLRWLEGSRITHMFLAEAFQTELAHLGRKLFRGELVCRTRPALRLLLISPVNTRYTLDSLRRTNYCLSWHPGTTSADAQARTNSRLYRGFMSVCRPE